MQRMFEFIRVFSDLMKSKGYDGYFSSSFGFNDKLKDNLTKLVFQCFEEKRNLERFSMTTYSEWKDDESPFVRCNFDVAFSEPQGFQVMKMNIKYANQYGEIRSDEVQIRNNADILGREQANNMAKGIRKGKRI